MPAAFMSQAKDLYFPFNYVLPSGDLFVYCGNSGMIIDALTGTSYAVRGVGPFFCLGL